MIAVAQIKAISCLKRHWMALMTWKTLHGLIHINHVLSLEIRTSRTSTRVGATRLQLLAKNLKLRQAVNNNQTRLMSAHLQAFNNSPQQGCPELTILGRAKEADQRVRYKWESRALLPKRTRQEPWLSLKPTRIRRIQRPMSHWDRLCRTKRFLISTLKTASLSVMGARQATV